MSIEFKENAVCYASDRLWFEAENHNDCLADCDGVVVKTKYIVNCHDFQLNEPKQGDYLPKSELDTEQKYNDAVEVFGLFGFEPLFSNYHDCSPANTLYFINEYRIFIGGCHSNVNPKRELTYNQLMAIGKLKRLMNEREIKQAVKSTINTEPDKPLTISANKYEREISGRQGNSATVDVYDVLKAFEVTCPATQHAVKKLLCSGIRGHKDLPTDLIEAKESIVRAIELNEF